MTPEFAILGHPNEGKSSVLSTLAEDDSVRVSSTPGETTACRTFPVVIDGKEVLKFTDTPGFQNPGRVLSELRKRAETDKAPLSSFREFARDIPELHDDYELLAPLERGAGIIYVVDGSRPLRNVDKTEMEILRLTGKPRMAIINCKEGDTQYLEDWKSEFRKNFNSSRTFNAHRATYAERILLLEALKSIDQDWHSALDNVVNAFQQNWAQRNELTVAIITKMLGKALNLYVTLPGIRLTDEEENRNQEKLYQKYCKKLIQIETAAHQEIRTLFKHNIFNYELPPQSVLREDLLSEKTWSVLGLTRKQMLIAGGLGGAALGASLDIAALGHTLGLFTAIGGVAGAVGAVAGGQKFSSGMKMLGLPELTIGAEKEKMGPVKSMDLLFVLLNRFFLYYRHTINWAHGRRDYPGESENVPAEPGSFTAEWSSTQIKICHEFFRAVQKELDEIPAETEQEFKQLLLEQLQQISHAEK